jgi:type VI secretion system protein ImpE
MTPEELYRAGHLREAITALSGELKKNPLDARRRTFLFELLLFTGDFDRAEKQVNLLADGGPAAASGALVYRTALHAERTRQEMFAKKELPAIGEYAPREGACDGKPCSELRDADPRIGPNFEVFIAGSYTWIPTVYIRRIEFEKPACLRDLMWIRARLVTTPDFRLQDVGEVLIPALCPASSHHPEESVQLGRETAWREDPQYGALPFGGKIMSLDGVDVPLLSLRNVEWPGPRESDDAAA